MSPIYRLVPDFIYPSLERRTFGKHLQWEDRDYGSFKISRVHQSSEMWREECMEVYKAWSTKKKHWNASDPKKITRAKHRLITALRRNPDIEILEKESSFYRFRIKNLSTSDGNSSYEEPAQEMEVSSTTKENLDIGKYMNQDDSEMRNDPSTFKEQQNLIFFNDHETDLNPIIAWPILQDNSFGDVFYYEEEKSTETNYDCLCEILGDNFLCNPKCLLHGMPP